MDCHSPLEITAVSEAEQISEQAESLTALFVKSVLKHVPTESLEKILGEEGLKEKILELGKKSEGSGSNS